jgi:hypothetical protein
VGGCGDSRSLKRRVVCGGRKEPHGAGRHGEEEEEEEEMVVCSTRKSFKDSLKVLEADIQHANTL